MKLPSCIQINDLDVGAIVSLKGQLHYFLIVFIAVVSNSEGYTRLNGSIDGSFVIFHTISIMGLGRNLKPNRLLGSYELSDSARCNR